MKAARFNEYNGPIVLESQVPVPSIGDEDALVKITYATINPLDLLVYKGYFRQLSPWSFPYIPGYDFAGVVESVGSKVTGLKVGERVTAISWRSDKPGSENDSHGGTFAEYLSIPAYKLSIIPPDVSDQEAAALVLVGPTAFQALFHLIKLPPNSRVLILGGSSAVGAVAIQLAKQKGAWVATTASPRNTAFVSQFGADVIIDYTSKKWEEEVKDIDAVFDAVGDKDSYIRSQLPGVLKEGGKYGTVANGAAVNYNPNLFIGMVQIKEVQDELLNLLAKKQLKIPIDTVFPFTQEGIRDIFAKQEANKANGKNLLHVA